MDSSPPQWCAPFESDFTPTPRGNRPKRTSTDSPRAEIEAARALTDNPPPPPLQVVEKPLAPATPLLPAVEEPLTPATPLAAPVPADNPLQVVPFGFQSVFALTAPLDAGSELKESVPHFFSTF
ncbi:hypothetical protein IFR05_017605, partial [Cadophora sp. M221]